MDYQLLKLATSTDVLPCYSMIRNEIYFLPHFLDHYRRLGVGHFLIYDDGSTDGSRELLLAQDDCTVLTSDHRFNDVLPDGMAFNDFSRTAIPEHYGRGGWCLNVDADEFMILPPNYRNLNDCIADLEMRGHACVLAAMVDFYPRTLSQRAYEPGLSPFQGCEWWFDRDPGFLRIPGTDRKEIQFKGVRARLLLRLRNKEPERFAGLFPAHLTEGGRVPFARLWKVPLLKTGCGIAFRDPHQVNVPVPSDVQLVLAHFKFHPSTDAKIREALERKTYFGESSEYRLLEAAVECFPNDSLLCDRSVRFTGPADLETAGLLFANVTEDAGTPV